MSSIGGFSSSHSVGAAQAHSDINVAKGGTGQVWGRSVSVASGQAPVGLTTAMSRSASEGGTSLADREVTHHPGAKVPSFSLSQIPR